VEITTNNKQAYINAIAVILKPTIMKKVSHVIFFANSALKKEIMLVIIMK